MNNDFSVLMSIYKKENPIFLEEALNSVFDQTVKPKEVVLVEDGELTDELYKVIEKFKKKYKELKILSFKVNRGLGFALKDGLEACNNEYVFRMDTDDICCKNRFEIQLDFMKKHPDVDVLGTNIFEFKDSVNEKMRKKVMPRGSDIASYMKKRNPLNHMTVCFKKSSVLECGSYLPMLYLEDYYLWVRMYLKGKKIENINEELVFARIGNGFEKRRGNKNQIKGWKKLQKFMLDEKMISKYDYFSNMIKMYLMIICPNFIRKIIYGLFLRG